MEREERRNAHDALIITKHPLPHAVLARLLLPRPPQIAAAAACVLKLSLSSSVSSGGRRERG